MSSRCGIIGSSAGAELHARALPLAHQWTGSTPFEKKTIPSRRGGVFPLTQPGPAPRSGSDSIQGSASATPMPRRKWRRDG